MLARYTSTLIIIAHFDRRGLYRLNKQLNIYEFSFDLIKIVKSLV